jgi:Flp pilus assembly protein TadB
MSKERARRRAEREREAAIKQAARAAEVERRERQAARRRAVRNAGRRVGLGRTTSRPDSVLARRRHRQHAVVLGLLVVLLVVGFAVRPDWASRLAFVVVAVLAYPVLRVLLFRRV